MDWKGELAELRAEKDEWFKSHESPLTDDLRKGFTGLKYWPVSDKFRVKAKVERLQDAEVITMEVSRGQQRKMVKAARLSFEVDGKTHSLIGYTQARSHGFAVHEKLFVPFRDGTSAHGSYGAGRYIDLEDPGGAELTLDFNDCYSPYCAYSDDYSCPLPPRENWLELRVEAGEADLGRH
ncbi:MAG: DUF1684 domain-containing protein [Myxococcaceae bacterium]